MESAVSGEFSEEGAGQEQCLHGGKTNIGDMASLSQKELGACSLHPGWVGGGQLLIDSSPHLRRKHVGEVLGLWEDEAQGRL